MGEKKTITRDDYLRLVGLLTLARDHNRMLNDLNRSAAAILDAKDEGGGGDHPYFGHVSDAVFSDMRTADELCRLLEITVIESETTP